MSSCLFVGSPDRLYYVRVVEYGLGSNSSTTQCLRCNNRRRAQNSLLCRRIPAKPGKMAPSRPPSHGRTVRHSSPGLYCGAVASLLSVPRYLFNSRLLLSVVGNRYAVHPGRKKRVGRHGSSYRPQLRSGWSVARWRCARLFSGFGILAYDTRIYTSADLGHLPQAVLERMY